MIELLIIRGLPGSGKSTLAKSLAKSFNIFSADDYFTDEHGTYRWDANKLTEAHADCFEKTRKALLSVSDSWDRAYRSGLPMFQTDYRVVVTNVFVKKSQVAPYAALIHDPELRSLRSVLRGGQERRYRSFVIDLFDQNMNDHTLAKTCVHGISAEKIGYYRAQWEH